MFKSNVKEKQKPEITLRNPYGYVCIADCSIMDILFDYIYTGVLNLSGEVAQNVLLAAEYLGMNELKEKCIGFLLNSINQKSWMDIYLMASFMGLARLKKKCEEICLLYYNHLNLVSLDFNDFQQIVQVLVRNNVCSTKVFRIVMSWLKLGESVRQKHAKELLQCVDLLNLNRKFVESHVLTESLVLEQQSLVEDIKRTISERRIILVGTNYRQKVHAVRYDPVQKSISTVRALKGPFYCYSVAQHGSKLLLLVKECNSRLSSLVLDSEMYVQIFDMVVNRWTHKFKLAIHSKYYQPATAVIDDKLFLIGGNDASGLCDSSDIHVFDLNRNDSTTPIYQDYETWSLHQARHGHSVVTRDKLIYVIGGYNWGSLNTCEMIDTCSKKVKTIASMNVTRTELSAVAFDDTILAIGGWGSNMGLAAVESYSFEDDVWSHFQPMTLRRYYHCASVFDGKVFVFGGNSTTSVEYFDPDLEEWQYDHCIDMKCCYFSTVHN